MCDVGTREHMAKGGGLTNGSSELRLIGARAKPSATMTVEVYGIPWVLCQPRNTHYRLTLENISEVSLLPSL